MSLNATNEFIPVRDTFETSKIMDIEHINENWKLKELITHETITRVNGIS